MLRDILSEKDEQVEAVIRVIRQADADVLVLADVDYDLELMALNALSDRIGSYPYSFARRPNRGRPSGHDLDGDGKLGGPGDAFGYATYQGQGGLALLSRFPIDSRAAWELTQFRWADLPDAEIPANTPENHPLSTTAHWVVPITSENGTTLEMLIWHATPPVFDGPEDRNGKRNHDETALWLAYLDGTLDRTPADTFVFAGVANLDPVDGDGRVEALDRLLTHERVQDPKPQSLGGIEAANPDHRGNPALDTADWTDGPGRPGNLRVDYVLPSVGITIIGSGVLWPLRGTSLGRDVESASRHRLVWVDLELPDRVGEPR